MELEMELELEADGVLLAYQGVVDELDGFDGYTDDAEFIDKLLELMGGLM